MFCARERYPPLLILRPECKFWEDTELRRTPSNVSEMCGAKTWQPSTTQSLLVHSPIFEWSVIGRGVEGKRQAKLAHVKEKRVRMKKKTFPKCKGEAKQRHVKHKGLT
eukprot:3487984-Amphidinium_carterae.1